MDPNEKVLCVPAEDVKDFMSDTYHSFGDDWTDSRYGANALFTRPCFIARGKCETDPSFKQIIPYVYILSEETDQIFVYERGKASSEGRLESLLSIGVGGHINPCDAPFMSKVVNPRDITHIISRAAWREFSEEVKLLVPPISFQAVGVVSENDTDVGKHHVGIVFECQLAHPELEVNEKSAVADGRWVHVLKVDKIVKHLEPWSRIVMGLEFGVRE